jgi:hypothetical protein
MTGNETYEMARGAAVGMLTIKLFGIYIVINIFVPIPFFSSLVSYDMGM